MSTQTFNIVLPQELVSQIDEVAKQEYKNRSELIREAVRIYVQRKGNWEKIFAYGKKKAKELSVKNEKQVNNVVYQLRHGRKA